MNNVDVAEAMIEVCMKAMKDHPVGTTITWDDLLKALQKYIIAERHEIEKLRKLKDKPFG